VIRMEGKLDNWLSILDEAFDASFQYQIQNRSNTLPTFCVELLGVKYLANKVNRLSPVCKLLGALSSHHLYVLRDG
jgi:hypothetical protein